MQPGRMQFQRNQNTNRPRVRNEFKSRKMIIEPYEILGKTIFTVVKEGTKVEDSLPKAVEENGGKVFQKWNSQYKKYEIAAVVFRDRGLVKNDPKFIAAQDFSCFGKDAEKIKKRTIEEAKKSEGGVHIAENEKGIPVIVNKDGSLIFPSPDEMLVNGNKKKIEILNVNIDPKTREEFQKGAIALANNNRPEIEKLRKASADHGQSREKDIEPTSNYILLDRYTGDEMGAGALNSKLGRNLVFASTEEFVPQKLLIAQFRTDLQIHKDKHQQSSWDWKLHISDTFRNEDVELPSVYTSFTLERDVAVPTPQSSEETTKQDAPVKQEEVPRKFNPPIILSKLAIPKHAKIFDGFSRFKTQHMPALKAQEKVIPAPNPFKSRLSKIANPWLQKVETMKKKEPMKTIQANKPKNISVIQNKKLGPRRIKAASKTEKPVKKKTKKKPIRTRRKTLIAAKKNKAKKPASRKIKPAKTRKHLAPMLAKEKIRTSKKNHKARKPSQGKKRKQELAKTAKRKKPAKSRKKEIKRKKEKPKTKPKTENPKRSLIRKRTKARSSSRKRARLLSLIL
jgi:hypothetical protein